MFLTIRSMFQNHITNYTFHFNVLNSVGCQYPDSSCKPALLWTSFHYICIVFSDDKKKTFEGKHQWGLCVKLKYCSIKICCVSAFCSPFT